jgi:methylglutaconyl-CoA hydratase
MDAYVRSITEQGITTIEFFHPQSNSLPGTILKELASAITQAGLDRETIIIILRSAGEKAFCAGASFDELMAIKSEEEGLIFFSGFAHLINAMRNCPKFIMGRVHGKCVGGGVGLAAAVDYAIATEGADIKLSELAIGIGPFVVGPVIERRIGVAAFSQLAIDAASWRNAQWAGRKGLFAEVHPDLAGMDGSLTKMAGMLVQSSSEAMATMKKIFWTGTENWNTLLLERAAISGRLVLSDFTRNAIEKFKSK